MTQVIDTDAYYLKKLKPRLHVLLIDSDTPMSLTSSVSGENYRNWWPHPIMKSFMDRSIELLEDIHNQAEQRIIATRNGYLLASRDAQPEALLSNLRDTYTQTDQLRFHATAHDYASALSTNTDGVDVLSSPQIIRQYYPGFDKELRTLVHIRRGGCIASHALGSYMLSEFKGNKGVIQSGMLTEMHYAAQFQLTVQSKAGARSVRAASVVNAGGPFAGDIAALLGVTLPIENVLQQKIAFADHANSVDRRQPFAIDLDSQLLDWNQEERDTLREDPKLAFLADTMPGAIHCRPEGGVHGKYIKLGWAYNTKASHVVRKAALDSHFPEIVLRGAARLNPGLKHYYNGFPREFTHYGGFYTMTAENWPVIGETPVPGFFVTCALSGFGTMAAPAAGELTALHVLGDSLPTYAVALSLKRYKDAALMNELAMLHSNGIL